MKKLITITLLIFIVTSIITGYAHYVYIPKKIENKVINNLEQFGFKKPSLENISKDNGKITFSNIVLDEKGFSSIKEVRVYFSIFNFILTPDKAQKIVIDGIKLSGELHNNKISISGWDNNQKILQKFKDTPANIIVIKNASIDLLSDDLGGIKLDYNGQARLLENGDIKIKGNITSQQKKLSFQSKVNGSISNNGNISITLESDQISLTKEKLNIRRGAATMELKHLITPPKTSIFINADFSSVNWHDMPLRDVNLEFNYNNEITPNSYSLTAKGQVFGNEVINWSAKKIGHKDDNTSKIYIDIEPDSFGNLLSFLSRNKVIKDDINFPAFILESKHPQISINTSIENGNILSGNFEFTNKIPEFKLSGKFKSNEITKNIKGKFFISTPSIANKNSDEFIFNQKSLGEFIIRNIKNTASIEWYLKTKIYNSAINYGNIELNNINGKFLYNSNIPDKTNNYLKFKINLKDNIKQAGRIYINISDRNKPFFDRSIIKIYDGTIKGDIPRFKSDGSLVKNIDLTISDINLTKLFKDAKFNNVKILGKLGGVLPISFNENRINVNGGILQSQGSGLISLSDKLINGFFPANDNKSKLIRKSLKNYYYDFFEIRLDGDLSDKVMVTINSKGYNPRIKNTQTVDINLQIEIKASSLFENIIKK